MAEFVARCDVKSYVLTIIGNRKSTFVLPHTSIDLVDGDRYLRLYRRNPSIRRLLAIQTPADKSGKRKVITSVDIIDRLLDARDTRMKEMLGATREHKSTVATLLKSKRCAARLGELPTVIDVEMPSMYDLPATTIRMTASTDRIASVKIDSAAIHWITSVVAQQYTTQSGSGLELKRNRTGYRPHRTTDSRPAEDFEVADEVDIDKLDADDLEVASEVVAGDLDGDGTETSPDADEDHDGHSAACEHNAPKHSGSQGQSSLHMFFNARCPA